MKSLLVSIRKDFKILIRSKLASFIIILAPLLLIFLIGFAFNAPEQYNLNIGIYSESKNNLTDDIIASMKDSTFSVIEYTDQKACVENIKFGMQNACVIFPKDMQIGNTNNTIEILVDTSKTNIAWIVKDIIQNKLEKKSLEIRKNLTDIMLKELLFVENNTKQMDKEYDILIKELEDSAKKSTDVKTKAASFDTSIKAEDFKIADTVSKSALSKTNVNNLVIRVNELIAKIQENFDDIDAKIDSIGNSSLTSQAASQVDAARANLNTIANNIKAASNASSATITGVDDLVKAMDATVKDLKAKIDKNIKLKGEISAISDQLNNITNKILAETKELSKTVKEINAHLANIKIRESSEIASPIDINMDTITPSKSHMSVIFPQFVSIIIVFISLIISAIMRVHDKRSTASIRQRLSPVYNVTFIIGTYITNLIIVFIQFVIVVLITKFVLNLDLFQNIGELLLSVLFVSSCFIMLGMFLGQLFREEQSATIAAVSLLALLLFFSGIIIPLESLPQSFLSINFYNPFMMSISLIRANTFFDTSFAYLGNIYLALLLMTTIFYSLTMALVFRQNRRVDN